MAFIPREVEYGESSRTAKRNSVCYGVYLLIEAVRSSDRVCNRLWLYGGFLVLWRLELLQRLRGWDGIGLDGIGSLVLLID
jgi:hypothetical protein